MVKHMVHAVAGTIDGDYRGNVGVVLHNQSPEDFTVNVGDRIAQLIVERIVQPLVREVQALQSACRGAGGFGSTGLSQVATTCLTTMD